MKFAMCPAAYAWWSDDIKILENWVTEVESLGYDAIFLPDHYQQPAGMPSPEAPEYVASNQVDAWTTLSFIAAKTNRLKVGTCVSPIPRYIPSQLAKLIATVDVVSEGRVLAGFGAGWNPAEFVNYSPQGVWEEPKVRIEKMVEGLQIITKLWTGDKVTFDGKYYKLKDAILEPKPKQKPHPPLWLGSGAGPVMLNIAAKYFDAWLPPRPRPKEEGARESRVLTPGLADYEKGVNTIKAYLKKYNRNVNKFTFALHGFLPGKKTVDEIITDEIAILEKYVQAGCQYFNLDIVSYPFNPTEYFEIIRRFAKEVMPSFQ